MNKIYLLLNFRNEFIRIDISKIAYFEADGNYTNIVSANKLKSVVCMNLANMQQLLTERLKEQVSIFIRVGKRFIINRTYIYKINVPNQKLILSDGEKFIFQLNISKEALKNLKKLYMTVSTK